MFKIVTDNGADLSRSFLDANGVGCLYLSTILEGEVIANSEKELSSADFYRMLSNGAKPTTSQVNPEEASRYFEDHLQESDEFLYIGLSSGLSGTYGSVKSAIDALSEKYPDKRFETVDSLTGSPGEALLVHYAVKMRDEGKTLQETADWLREHAKHVLLCITVDNLFDLWRGGRVSKTSAFLGTLASIKPVLIVDDDGRLQVTRKIRGRKKSLTYLADYMEAHMGSYRDLNQNVVLIHHGNVPSDAEFTIDLMKKRFGFENIQLGNVGPMIGTHTGPSIVVVAFMGESRTD